MRPRFTDRPPSTERGTGSGSEPEAEPKTESEVMEGTSRKDFLKLGGTGLAGAAVFVVLPGAVLAQQRPQSAASPSGSLMAEFEEAAREYGLPVGILMSMGYVNTRLEMPSAEESAYEPGDLHTRGSYGIMALVQNPDSDTVGEASRLTGIPEEELKADRRANILGGAALLAESRGGAEPTTLSEYRGVVAGHGGAPGEYYAAVSGVGGGELFAGQVFGTLETGFSEETLSGESIALEAQNLADELTTEAENLADQQTAAAQSLADRQTAEARGLADELTRGITNGIGGGS